MFQRSQFKPAWWLAGPHLQTIMPNLFQRKTGVAIIRERIVLEDGDFIDLDWTAPCDGPLVLILHGLGGNVNSNYVQGILREVTNRGWQAVVMHFRGCSGEPNLLPRGYHVGETGDLEKVIETIKQRFPTRPLVAVGYSLGGNVLLKWLGEKGSDSPLKAAVAVSVPFDVHRTVKTLNKGMSRLYQWWFMRGLYRNVHEKAQILDLPVDTGSIKTTTSIADYDRKITAPLHGFESPEDYYNEASCLPFLKDISINTLILHAKDDPLSDRHPALEEAEMSEQVTVELSDSGGHIGFITGKYPWQPLYFLEERIPAFLEEQLGSD